MNLTASPRFRLPYAVAVPWLALVWPSLALAEPTPCAEVREILVDGLGTHEDDALRLAELAGDAPLEPRMVRRAGARIAQICQEAVEAGRLRDPPGSPEGPLYALPFRMVASWNSTYPSGKNDGLLWSGRGLSAEFRSGVMARWGVVTASLAPELAWQENETFPLVSNGQPGDLAYANPFYGPTIDLPQRFGDRAFTTASLGQSYIRMDAFGVGLGISNENLWLGPGTRNALLVTNEGPGFPHAFVGTSEPVGIGIGALEVQGGWGKLSRSPYAYDSRHVSLAYLAVDYAPRWLPGLTLGAARAYLQTWDSFAGDGFLSVLEPPVKSWLPGADNPEDNQVAALWLRWVFPEAGLELYGEWGREDFPVIPENLLAAPRRTQGWLWGMQKVFRAGDRLVRFQAELIRLHEPAAPNDVQVWYAHPKNLGWTQGGQMLGASVGPGGSSQYLGVDVFGKGGRLGGYVERTFRNEEIYYLYVAGPPGSQHDTEVAVGLRHLFHAGPVKVAWEVAWAYRWNRSFLRDERNVHGGLELSIPFDHHAW